MESAFDFRADSPGRGLLDPPVVDGRVVQRRPPPDPDISVLRRQLGLSTEGLARELGVTPRTVFRWAAGQPMPEMARRLIRALQDLRDRQDRQPALDGPA